MSSTTKKKYVVDEVLNNYDPPTEDQLIVKVQNGRGNNLHEVLTSDGKTFLASMPSKFRKNIWIKRGDYVVVEPISEGSKVKAEIVHILMKDQIKHFKSLGIWPKEFEKAKDVSEDKDSDGLFVNKNRQCSEVQFSSSEDEENT